MTSAKQQPTAELRNLCSNKEETMCREEMYKIKEPYYYWNMNNSPQSHMFDRANNQYTLGSQSNAISRVFRTSTPVHETGEPE